MTIKFSERYKAWGQDFHPTVAYSLPESAEEFAVAIGVASVTSDEPVVEFGPDEVSVDPLTVWNNTDDPSRHGRYVMPALAAEARGITLEEAQSFVWSGQQGDNHHG